MRYAVRLALLNVKRYQVEARNGKEAVFVVMQRLGPRVSALVVDVQKTQRRKKR